MSRLPFALCLFLVGAFVLAKCPANVSAQAKAPDTTNPKIVTVDGVKLSATFYPSAKKNSPVVIMIHPIGDGKNSKSPDWKGLAETLQAKDFAVITFDLRGHGDSTTVDPELFWPQKGQAASDAQKFNYKCVKATKDPETIDVKDYINNPIYLPALANDIAAVKSYVERQNDAGDCNAACTFVIAADNGATLAAIWINSEWSRYRVITPPSMMSKGVLEKKAEGNDILGAAFLSITPSLSSKRAVKLSGILRNAVKEHGMPAAFFCGKDDAKAKQTAKDLEKLLEPKGKKVKDFVFAQELDTNLNGIKLLQKSLKTDEMITKYFERLAADNGKDWEQRDYVNKHYIWRAANMPAAIPARNEKGTKNLNFDDYNKFITP